MQRSSPGLRQLLKWRYHTYTVRQKLTFPPDSVVPWDDATVALTVHTTTADKVKVRAAPFLFFDPFIYLPAKSTGKSMTQSCGMPAERAGRLKPMTPITVFRGLNRMSAYPAIRARARGPVGS